MTLSPSTGASGLEEEAPRKTLDSMNTRPTMTTGQKRLRTKEPFEAMPVYRQECRGGREESRATRGGRHEAPKAGANTRWGLRRRCSTGGDGVIHSGPGGRRRRTLECSEAERKRGTVENR